MLKPPRLTNVYHVLALLSIPCVANRPNMVLIVTDQERAPTSYENEELAAFRKKHLHGYRSLGCNDDSKDENNNLDTTCIEFTRHYTSSTACTPSRANLFTGQYASLHGLRYTDGLAKTIGDPEVRDLPLDVPTMGHYFEAAGYETRYIGKWHLSFEENLNGGKPTWPLGQERNLSAEEEYLREDKLEKYGFHGWIGPEPHGFAKANTAMWRDPQFVAQTLEWIQHRNATAHQHQTTTEQEPQEQKPFLLVLNLVNPHDICLWAAWNFLFHYPHTDDTVPPIPPPPTLHEDLSTKPSPQAGWKKYGAQFFQGLKSQEKDFRNFYYYLHKLADAHIATVVKALQDTPFWENTIVVRTSDHGEMLGAHGLLQKWYAAYDELLRVPLIVSSPLFSQNQKNKMRVEVPTSSVDVLPTMLSLAGLDQEMLRQKLESRHGEAHPLVGADLSPVITGNDDPNSPPMPIYSNMADHLTRGTSQKVAAVTSSHPVAKFLRGIYHFELDEVPGPSSMEVVVSYVVPKTGRDSSSKSKGTLWKLVRAYDDPQLWSTPFQNDTYVVRAGIWKRGKTIVRTKPLAEEWELYNLLEDPIEQVNLAHPKVLEKFSKNDTLLVEAKNARTILMEEMDRLRREKMVQRRTPLPSSMYHDEENHFTDLFELTGEVYGKLGYVYMGTALLMRTLVYQDPMLAVLFCGGVLTLVGMMGYLLKYVTRKFSIKNGSCLNGDQKKKMA